MDNSDVQIDIDPMELIHEVVVSLKSPGFTKGVLEAYLETSHDFGSLINGE